MNTTAVFIIPNWLLWLVVAVLFMSALKDVVGSIAGALHTRRALGLQTMQQQKYEAEFQPISTAPDKDIFCLLEDGTVVIGCKDSAGYFMSPDWHRGTRMIEPVGWSPMGGNIKMTILADKLKNAGGDV